MNPTEKEITYQSTKSYSTLNTLTSKTKHIWLVFHGMGYLSRYFLKYFRELDAEENYIIAPQAPSKYYLNSEFKHVGASWLTKENTIKETENVLNYIEAVLEAEQLPKDIKLIVLGFSQGVSIAMRYIASRQLVCDHLILFAGGIPKELEMKHLKFLKAKISLIYGTEDTYLTKERMRSEKQRLDDLFGDQAEILTFNGGHEVRVDLINNLI